MKMRSCLGLTVLALFLAVPAAAVEVPFLTGRVTDNAEILDQVTRDSLAGLLRDYEVRSGSQVVVLTVPTLGSDSIEEYAERIFNSWHLGQQGKNNGVLVLVAPSERRMRIEVGYGLEQTLTDLLCGRIIRDRMTPRFTGGDYGGGVTAGVTAILGVLEKGELPPSAESGPEAPAKIRRDFFQGPDLPLIPRILLGAFIFGIIGLFTVLGVLTPGMGWFLYFFLIPFWAMFPIIVVGVKAALALLCTYLVAFPVAKFRVSRTSWYDKARKDLRSKGSATIGGFTVTSGGSGGSSWSSGGAGFSGGGGCSGGGGASGSW